MANIDVTIVDAIGSTKRSAGLPNDIAVDRLTAALVRKMGLQMTGANGRPINYFLCLIRYGTSTQLNEDRTLEEQGVVVGDILRINAQMQAGGTKRKIGNKNFRKDISCFMVGGKCRYIIKEQKNSIFIAMPFGGNFDNLYEQVIKKLLKQLGYRPNRADEVKLSISIMCKICQLIQQASLNIVDITQWNPNVLLELGMMYGMGKTAILLKNKTDDIPVDLNGLEYIEYENYDILRKDLRTRLITGSDPSVDSLGKRCPVCHKDFELGQKIVTCVNDQIAHHLDCWKKNKECIVCKNNTYIF